MEVVAEKYQVMPPLTAEEYGALKTDIAERGVQVPVEYDEEGNILDGHHRVRACEELGIADWPRVVRRGMDDEGKTEHALALNLDRRHLTREQRRELVAELRGKGWSLPRIADRLGISVGTAHADTQVFKTESLPRTITGADGKTYPAYRPEPKESTEALTHDVQPDPAKDEADDVEAPVVEAVSPQEVDHLDSTPSLRPHVAHNGGNNEWYTPAEYIQAARSTMGGIDLDPASSIDANRVVGATRFYTAEDDGLKQDWAGRVWMNPPYAQPLIAQFCERLVYHAENGTVSEACVLVNNATETAWFQLLAQTSSAVCLPRGRVRFWAPGRDSAQPLQGQAVLYIGPNAERFAAKFAPFGVVMRA